MNCSDSTTLKQNKKKRYCLTFKQIVVICYLFSFISNSILFLILTISEHGFKWVGYICHLLFGLCLLVSIKNLVMFNNKNYFRYKAISKFLSHFIIMIFLFYLFIITYLAIDQNDNELLTFYIYTMIIWIIFHFLFVSIIKMFIRSLDDRPTLKTFDNGLQDLMLGSFNGD
jgi:hypothetical protein